MIPGAIAVYNISDALRVGGTGQGMIDLLNMPMSRTKCIISGHSSSAHSLYPIGPPIWHSGPFLGPHPFHVIERLGFRLYVVSGCR